MKNKKGFTMVEILIVIAIIAVLSLIAIPVVSKSIAKGKEKFNENVKVELGQMAKNYFSDNPKELPRGQKLTSDGTSINGIKMYSKVTLEELEKSNYVLNDVVDAYGNSCHNSYVVVELQNGSYEYHSCLKCEDKDYTEDSLYCKFTLSGENDATGDTGNRSCEISYETYEEEWLNHDLEVDIEAESEYEVVGFVDDNNKLIMPKNSSSSYTAKYMINKTGSYNIYALDRTGTKFKCGDNTLDIKIDKESPSCENIVGEGTETTWVNTDRTITFECRDKGGSGCLQTEYQETYTTDRETSTITIKDNANNETTCTIGVYIDKEAPTCDTVTGTSTTWTKNDRAITQKCNDNVSGCVKNSYTENFTATTKVGIITIADKANNQTECPVNVYVDKTKPTCTLSGTGSWAASQTLTITTTDIDLAPSPYSFTSETEGFGSAKIKSGVKKGTYSAYVKDAVGNVGTCSYDVSSRTEYRYNDCDYCTRCKAAGCEEPVSTVTGTGCTCTNEGQGGSTRRLPCNKMPADKDCSTVCVNMGYDDGAGGGCTTTFSCNKYKRSCSSCGCSSWGENWSSWSSTPASASKSRKIETRTTYK